MFENYFLMHNLLSITGSLCPQPFFSDDCACLFNGQIYNHDSFGDFSSDGLCLLPAYETYDLDFSRHLDGEFAVCIIDLQKNRLVLATDPFATKPLYFAQRNGELGVASYGSALESLDFSNVIKVPPNTLVVIDIKTQQIKINRPVWRFNTHQYKLDFDDWILTFENSIRKRAVGCREKILIGLSSGYDSGAIACELLKQGVPFKGFSFFNNEDMSVLKQRAALFADEAIFERVEAGSNEKLKEFEFIKENIEPENYFIYSSMNPAIYRHPVYQDPAATGLAVICSRAKAEGRKIYLSGQGSDEIISDYGHAGRPIYDHSNFGGLFPNDLEEIFPWPSFYGSTQESYLMKEEFVAGAYGIETRYPYLDKFLVQEFLNLDSKLKNYFYKAPLRKYLLENNFPISLDNKFGFVP
jgi:asparagine synthetase B (glutamine-hydrolysing)